MCHPGPKVIMCHPGPKGIPGPPGMDSPAFNFIDQWPDWLKGMYDTICTEVNKLSGNDISGGEEILDDLNQLIQFWEENKYENPFTDIPNPINSPNPPISIYTKKEYRPQWLNNIAEFMWAIRINNGKYRAGEIDNLNRLVRFWENNKYENPFK